MLYWVQKRVNNGHIFIACGSYLTYYHASKASKLATVYGSRHAHTSLGVHGSYKKIPSSVALFCCFIISIAEEKMLMYTPLIYVYISVPFTVIHWYHWFIPCFNLYLLVLWDKITLVNKSQYFIMNFSTFSFFQMHIRPCFIYLITQAVVGFNLSVFDITTSLLSSHEPEVRQAEPSCGSACRGERTEGASAAQTGLALIWVHAASSVLTVYASSPLRRSRPLWGEKRLALFQSSDVETHWEEDRGKKAN